MPLQFSSDLQPAPGAGTPTPIAPPAREREATTGEPVDMPLVSMLIAVRDEEDYLAECLQSVLAQTHRNLEVILVDDNSKDATFAIAERFRQRDARLQVMRAVGRGKVRAFNQAWQHARGDVIVVYAGDDVMPPNSVAERVALLRDQACEVGSGRVVSFSLNPKYDGIPYPRGEGPNYSGGALVMTRRFAAGVFPIPPELPNEDLWIRLHIDCFAARFPWTGTVVSRYRIHEANSMAFGAPFNTKSAVLARRARVYHIFLERFRDRLSREHVARLEAMVRLSELREQGKVMGILLQPRVDLRQKLATLSVATPTLYRLRLLVERHVMGR